MNIVPILWAKMWHVQVPTVIILTKYSDIYGQEKY